MKERVNSAINLLSEREQFIVRMRYGLIDGQPHKLDDICKPLGISRERVRVINNGALKKLSRMKAIRGFAPEKWRLIHNILISTNSYILCVVRIYQSL